MNESVDEPLSAWLRSKQKELDTWSFNSNPSIISYIVIHHSLTDDGATVNWNAIRTFHTSWRFGGNAISEQKARELQSHGLKVESPWRDVGYHFGIEQVKDDYQIMLGRELNIRGAHVGDGGFNMKSIGICLVGNFDKTPPPEKQFLLGQLLIKRLISYLGTKGIKIPIANVIGHWEAQKLAGVPEVGRKSCPGKMFDMQKFRDGLEGKGAV